MNPVEMSRLGFSWRALRALCALCGQELWTPRSQRTRRGLAKNAKKIQERRSLTRIARLTNRSEAKTTPPDSMPVKECWCVLDGYRMRYLCGGSGPPLLLLHGLLGYSFSWRFALPATGGESDGVSRWICRAWVFPTGRPMPVAASGRRPSVCCVFLTAWASSPAICWERPMAARSP